MIHKLANGPVTLTIASITEVDSQFDDSGSQYKVVGATDTDPDAVLFVSPMMMARQLARLSLTLETAIGRTIRFSHTKKDGKTYTNLDLVGAGGAAPASAPVAGTGAGQSIAPRAPKLDVPAAAALYAQCVDAAMATLGTKLEAAGVPVSDTALQAAAATLFIAVSR